MKYNDSVALPRTLFSLPESGDDRLLVLDELVLNSDYFLYPHLPFLNFPGVNLRYKQLLLWKKGREDILFGERKVN